MRVRVVGIRWVSAEPSGSNGEKKEDTDDVLTKAEAELLLAKAEMYRAEAKRIDQERKLVEDWGCVIKELASKAEAEAFVAQAERTLREKTVEGVLKELGKSGKLLVVEEKVAELERSIARNKDQATRPYVPGSNGRQSRGRYDKRQGQPPEAQGREVPVSAKIERFNTVKGAEAIQAMKSEAGTP